MESSLHLVLPDHLNAEIVAGTLKSKQDTMDYLTWTYFFRRLLQNPSYYNLEGLEEKDLNVYLTNTVEQALGVLEESGCVEFDDDGRGKNRRKTAFSYSSTIYVKPKKSMVI